MKQLTILVAVLALAAHAAGASQAYFLSRVTSSTGSGPFHLTRRLIGGPFKSYDTCSRAADAARSTATYRPGRSVAFVCQRRSH